MKSFGVFLFLLLVAVVFALEKDETPKDTESRKAVKADNKDEIEVMYNSIDLLKEEVKGLKVLIDTYKEASQERHDRSTREARNSSQSEIQAKTSSNDVTYIPGPPGPRGPAGRDGRDGRDSVCVSQTGTSYGGGAVFTRWGSATCNSGQEQLYHGTIATSNQGHKGSGANYLCLPETPIYSSYASGRQSYALIYGAEYESSYFSLYSKSCNYEGACSVCRVPTRGSVAMIPARNVCPSGWTREYSGYLMSAHYGNYGKSEYICVDLKGDGVTGSSSSTNQAYLYFVEVGVAGSSYGLAKYNTDRELTCAVCTR